MPALRVSGYLSWRMRRTTAPARGAIAAGSLLSDHSRGAATARNPHGRKSRSAQTRQLLHHYCDCPRVRFVKTGVMAPSPYSLRERVSFRVLLWLAAVALAHAPTCQTTFIGTDKDRKSTRL